MTEYDPSPIKKKIKFQLHNTNDEYRQKEGDGVRSWNVIGANKYSYGMTPFVCRELKRQTAPTILEAQEIFMQRGHNKTLKEIDEREKEEQTKSEE